ncbi:MAG: hypothetical protein KFB97_14895 [Cyanobium sp. M30B3]|nr:MAG: hypothetical protein KFB97_14895 [Cyanobium sp. M30B3]
MTALLRLVVLPLRAPLLLLLLAVAVYEGIHWNGAATELSLAWVLECLQAVVVVLVCTMPDLLLQQVSSAMAASRVVSLVVTLLLVTVGGLYLLHLRVLANVLILAAAVLLARLDLARIRVAPHPLVLSTALTSLVLAGAALGRWIVR